MSTMEIKHLLNNRLPDNDISLLLFIVYIPLGIIILLLRVILLLGLFLLAQILPDTQNTRKIIQKLACLAVGITFHIENCKTKEKVNVYISNSVSIFDQLIISNATGSISPSARTTLERVLGLSTYCFANIENIDRFKSNVNKFIAENQTPLYFAPEGRPTNGKGLLKFKTYPFELTSKIQPVCITIKRPYLDISVTSLGSSYLSDIIYFMLCPTTNYKLKFLPPFEKNNQTDEEFADVIRSNIATALKIEPTDYTSNDVAEWEKRKLAEDQLRAQGHNTTRAFNPELQRMTVQVREVLPHVPFNVIYNDLCSTRNVDSTITNILEGRILFTPEQSSTTYTATNIPSPSTTLAAPSNTVASSSPNFFLNTAASSFPKSASDRSKSFQERKEQLIASCRKRYIEKHNLDISL